MFLIDPQAQTQIAKQIDRAVQGVLAALASHGSEEATTSALGHALMRHSVSTPNLKVDFKYRQHNKITEEPDSGADGNFLVRVTTPSGSVEKATLFQAKLIRGLGEVRSLKISSKDASRLQKQAKDMLKLSEEAVAMFYTHRNIYVVDARDYGEAASSNTPLSDEHRLITLGTYLGKWMPRCTKGDERLAFVTKARHMEGFKHGLTMDVVAQRPAVSWEPDHGEDAWRRRR